MAGEGRRMGLITIDQALSGGSNLLTILLVAHFLSPGDFGVFTLLFLIYSLATTGVRSLVSGPLLVHPHEADRAPGDVIGSGVAVSLIMSAVCLAAGLIILAPSHSVGLGCVILAALLPLLLLQDLGRFVSWAERRPGRSLWFDGVWLALEIAGFALVLLTGHDLSLLGCVAIWAGSGAAAGLLVLVHYPHLRPRHVNLGWLRGHWDFSWKYLVSTFATQGAVLIGAGLIAGITSAAAVAAVRSVTLLTRPGFAVKIAIGQSLATDIARDDPRNAELWRHVRRGIAVTALASALNVGALLMVNDDVGKLILGDTWPLAAVLVLPAGLQLFIDSLATGTRETIIARKEIGLVAVIEVAGSVMWVLAAGIGAALGGAKGVVWAGVVVEAVRAAVWWGFFLRRLPQWNAAKRAEFASS
jgi:O-antigen/teichoic acid export membrane protein